MLLGVIGALGAQLFLWMLRLCDRFFLYQIAGYRAPGSTETGIALGQTIGSHGLWLIPLVTTVGGLLSGILVYTFAPEAEGHGTDTVVNAFHRHEGLIRPQVAPVKMLASAITIGSGGAAGREGPIALVAAGIASIYARLADRSEEERRLLLLAGMAAGLSAIFRSPLGTAVFAVEVLYGNMEFEVGALLYTIIASAVAYAVNGAFVGFQPLFHVPAIPVPGIADYVSYAVLGIAGGVIGTLVPLVFYRMRDFFHMLPLPPWTKPGLGGLGVGLIALWLPQVLGGGYGWIQQAINGQLALHLLLVLIFAKLLAFALTVSSGGSGGVFAPSLFVGAMLGGSFAAVFHQVPAVFVVVGMAAVFGAAARVPIATMLMVTEMVGGYHLLLPAGMAVMLAYLLQVRLSSFVRYHSLYADQVPTRQDSPAHYREQIQGAFRLLGKPDMPMMNQLRHLDLLRLLQSGVRFDLPKNRELVIGMLRDDSSLAGKTIRAIYRQLHPCDFTFVAVLRGQDALRLYSETVVKPADRVILIVSPDARAVLAQHIAPLANEEESATNPPPSISS